MDFLFKLILSKPAQPHLLMLSSRHNKKKL